MEQATQTRDLFATANNCLLAPYEIDNAGLQNVFGQMLSHHVDYADLYFQYSRAEGWSLEEGIVKLQHRPGRGGKGGQRRQDGICLLRRYQHAGAGLGCAGHARHRTPRPRPVGSNGQA